MPAQKVDNDRTTSSSGGGGSTVVVAVAASLGSAAFLCCCVAVAAVAAYRRRQRKQAAKVAAADAQTQGDDEANAGRTRDGSAPSWVDGAVSVKPTQVSFTDPAYPGIVLDTIERPGPAAAGASATVAVSTRAPSERSTAAAAVTAPYDALLAPSPAAATTLPGPRHAPTLLPAIAAVHATLPEQPLRHAYSGLGARPLPASTSIRASDNNLSNHPPPQQAPETDAAGAADDAVLAGTGPTTLSVVTAEPPDLFASGLRPPSHSPGGPGSPLRPPDGAWLERRDPSLKDMLHRVKTNSFKKAPRATNAAAHTAAEVPALERLPSAAVLLARHRSERLFAAPWNNESVASPSASAWHPAPSHASAAAAAPTPTKAKSRVPKAEFVAVAAAALALVDRAAADDDDDDTGGVTLAEMCEWCVAALPSPDTDDDTRWRRVKQILQHMVKRDQTLRAFNAQGDAVTKIDGNTVFKRRNP